METMCMLLGIFLLVPVIYLYGLFFAAWALRPILKYQKPSISFAPETRFLVIVTAHDGELGTSKALARIHALDYPKNLFDVIVVGDPRQNLRSLLTKNPGVRLLDQTSFAQMSADARLQWMISHTPVMDYDAMVLFDARSIPSPDFLGWMNERILLGEEVIQGKRLSGSQERGALSPLFNAIHYCENLSHTAGRDTLGLSVNFMFDSVCLVKSVVKDLKSRLGKAQEGAVAQDILFSGIRVSYEERAVSFALTTPTPAVVDAAFSAFTPGYFTWARFMLAFTTITFILQWNFPENIELQRLLQSGLVGCGLGVIFLVLSLAMVAMVERPSPVFRRAAPFHSRRVLVYPQLYPFGHRQPHFAAKARR